MSKKRKIVFFTLLLIAAACAVFLIVFFVRIQMNNSLYAKIKDEAYSNASSAQTPSATPTETPAPTTTPTQSSAPVSDVSSEPASAPSSQPDSSNAASTASAAAPDLAALQAQYPDVYAWIRIDGTQVDYPVLQSKVNNSYYLNHNVDGSEGHPGAIFTESYNSTDFTDYNNVLYGHNLTYEGGTMFTMLHDYMKMDFMLSHPTIRIFLPDRTLTYEVFSAVTYDDRDIMTNFDFTTSAGRQTYLDSLSAARTMDSPWRDDVTVDADSHLLTLSTCIDGYPANRRVVSAVLTDPQDLPTPSAS